MTTFPRWIFWSTGLGAILTFSGCSHNRDGTPIKEESTGLAAEAKIDAATARHTALARVPQGRILHEEIEREEGKLVYSFDMKKGGEPGVEEVRVDAMDGSVVSVDHEDPVREAAEAKQDSGAHQ
jgi:uncharacterized membrane protein YkoI